MSHASSSQGPFGPASRFQSLQASGRQPVLRRTHVLTFAPNGWFETLASDGTGLWGSHFLTIGCPDDFHAVRLGFANITPSAYVIPRIVVCPSTTWNDLVNPTGGGRPTVLTAALGGADDNRLVTATGAPHRLVVRGNTVDPSSGEAGVPEWSWTDWCSVTSAKADPKSGMRVLMIRHTVEHNGSAVTFTNGTFRGWAGQPAMNGGYEYYCGGVKHGSDRTGFEVANPNILPTNMVVNGSFIAAVQFLTRSAGIVGVTTGDSHHQGTGTTGSCNSYLAQTTIGLRRSDPNLGPFGWANCAVGGARSQQFFPYLSQLLRHVTPSYVVLPGWTANEPGPEDQADKAANDIFFARLLLAADAVRGSGAVPIWLTPFPRDAAFMTPSRLVAWRDLRQRILAMRAGGELVADATPVLGRADRGGVLDGTYQPGTTEDGIHPNDQGHARIAALVSDMVRALLHG
jgi:hypothetical protein